MLFRSRGRTLVELVGLERIPRIRTSFAFYFETKKHPSSYTWSTQPPAKSSNFPFSKTAKKSTLPSRGRRTAFTSVSRRVQTESLGRLRAAARGNIRRNIQPLLQEPPTTIIKSAQSAFASLRTESSSVSSKQQQHHRQQKSSVTSQKTKKKEKEKEKEVSTPTRRRKSSSTKSSSSSYH